MIVLDARVENLVVEKGCRLVLAVGGEGVDRLAVFVLAWIFGPYPLRAAVPIWLPFLIALGLELHFFVGARRPARAGRPDRGPEAADRERYGYGTEAEELVLVRELGEAGETGEEFRSEATFEANA